jgi:uncharacterized protein YfdQ (DUF2303 family)
VAAPDTRPDSEVAGNGPAAPRILVASHFIDPKSGALYVHKDLELTIAPWETEAHVGPPRARECFGDIASWVDYVKRYGAASSGAGQAAGVLLTWNSTGFTAVLDYHQDDEQPGRCQWTASYPFPFSPEYRAWTEFANGQPRSQRSVVEKLEDLGENITAPPQAQVLDLLRDLRGSVNAEARTTWNEDGTTDVAFERKEAVRSARGGEASIPPFIDIKIPILKGEPTDWTLHVRVRVTPDDAAHLVFRLSIPNLETTVDQVLEERVQAAKDQLGDGYSLLRAADQH